MVTLSQLKKIREDEGRKLKLENKKIMEARKLGKEKQKLIQDIKKIRESRKRDRLERQVKAKRELRRITQKGMKVGNKVLDFLERLSRG